MLFAKKRKSSQQNRRRPTLEALERREVFSATIFTGPSSSAAPYVLPTAPNVEITSILTVGDAVQEADKPAGDTYRMAGIPDGLGAYDNGNGTFTVLMNHEFSSAVGIPRDHGSAGSFVSKWVIRKSDLKVLSGDDLIKTAYIWNSSLNGGAGDFELMTTAFNRLCSADLPDAGAFYNPASGLGTTTRIFMNGEETSNGRAFAHIIDGPEAGTSWELPWTGKYAWENHVTSPFAQDKTIVVGLDDSSRSYSSEGSATPSEVYVWVGDKQATGIEIERAGLRYGVLNGIRVGTPGNYDANESTVTSGERFELVALTDQTNNPTFNALQTESIANSITQFRRVEDGAFDPNSPNDFYFVTTDQFGATGASKLWRLRFDDITIPESGGKIELLIDGGGVGSNSGFGTGEMFDNLAVDKMGRVLLQEDVGNQSHLGKMWIYDIASGAVLEVARHDPNLFLSTSPGYLGTQDEEASGIIDVSDILGDGTYLFVDQIHRNISAAEPELVELGQFALMKVGATAGIGFDSATNNPALVVLGSSKNDKIEIAKDGAFYEIGIGNKEWNFLASGFVVDRVFAVGYDGNDKIELDDIAIDAAIYGGAGNDKLTGGDGDDYIDGGDGNDDIDGKKGTDVFKGGAGNDDFIVGLNEGDSILDLGNGKDKVKTKKNK